ncbi:MAG: haloacid dehalogenase [Chloroflexota bacterium]|nr:MAG: haloacid dehalogenase [Chloroflexota bacterium]
MMKTRLQAVLFDYDGTIANTDLIHLDCWNHLLAQFQIRFEPDFYVLNCAGVATDHITLRLARDYPAAGLSPTRLAADKDALYEEWMNRKSVPLMPGVPEMLTFLLQHGIAAAIVTGGRLGAMTRTLETHGIAHHFRTVVTREDVIHAKPSPEGYLLGLQRLQLPAHSVLALEDTASGVLAAKAAGLITCALPHVFTRNHDFSTANVVCTDMHQAITWIDEQFLGGNAEH